jgi:hypothetical protein
MKARLIIGVNNFVVRTFLLCFLTAVVTLLLASPASAQNGCTSNSGCTPAATDPGPRLGPQPNTGAGHPIPGLPTDQNKFWGDGLKLFEETVSVTAASRVSPWQD